LLIRAKVKTDTNWVKSVFIFITWIHCNSTQYWNSVFVIFFDWKSFSSTRSESNSRLTLIKSSAFSFSVWFRFSSLQSINCHCIQWWIDWWFWLCWSESVIHPDCEW
jgi:hypothetical protein